MSSSKQAMRWQRDADAISSIGHADQQIPTSDSNIPSRAPRIHQGQWLTLLVVLFVALAWVSWGRIESPIIDFGRESRFRAGWCPVKCYIATSDHGPLAYYANAALLATSVIARHIIRSVSSTTIETLLIYGLARRHESSHWATLCSAYVLIYCVFYPGLFNFLAPYSCGAVYATVLCLLAFHCFDRHAVTSSSAWLAAAGMACVLAAVAKQEYGAAALAGLLAGIAAQSRVTLSRRLRDASLVTVGVGAGILLVIALCAAQAGWGVVSQSLLPTSALSAVSQRLQYFLGKPSRSGARPWLFSSPDPSWSSPRCSL